MLVRGGSNRLEKLSSEGEGKNQSFLLPFPISGHQEVPLTFRVILLASDNSAPDVQGATTLPQPHLYSGQILETEASSEERGSQRGCSQDTLPEGFTPQSLGPQHSGAMPR